MGALIATAWAWLRVRPGQVAAGHMGQAFTIGLVGLAAVIGLMWLRHDAVAAYEARSRASVAEEQLATDRAGEDAAQAEREKYAAIVKARVDQAIAAERARQALGAGTVVFTPEQAKVMNQ